MSKKLIPDHVKTISEFDHIGSNPGARLSSAQAPVRTRAKAFKRSSTNSVVLSKSLDHVRRSYWVNKSIDKKIRRLMIDLETDSTDILERSFKLFIEKHAETT